MLFRSQLSVTTGGSSGGDPYIRINISGIDSWIVGIDNSDSDKFKISDHNTDIGTNPRLIITSDGEITMPDQPAFLYYNSTARLNVTGDGTKFTCIYNGSIYDQNSDFDGTSTFTAPVSGRYHFVFAIPLDGIQSGHEGYTNINASNRTLQVTNFDLGVMKTASGGTRGHLKGQVYVDMDSADTVTLSMTIRDRKSTRLNSSHIPLSRMPSSA